MPDQNAKHPQHSRDNKSTAGRTLNDLIDSIVQAVAPKPAKKTAREIVEGMSQKEVEAFGTFLASSDLPTRSYFIMVITQLHASKQKIVIPEHKTFVVTDSINKLSYLDYAKFWSNFATLNHVPVPPSQFHSQVGLELKQVVDEIQEFRGVAMQKLETALNAYLGAVAQSQRFAIGKGKPEDQLPLAEKQAIVNTINSTLESLDLAVNYKGRPCYFSTAGGTSEGRFLLVPKGVKTALLARANLADFLPLELMDAQPRRVFLKEWRDREEDRQVAKTKPPHKG